MKENSTTRVVVDLVPKGDYRFTHSFSPQDNTFVLTLLPTHPAAGKNKSEKAAKSDTARTEEKSTVAETDKKSSTNKAEMKKKGKKPAPQTAVSEQPKAAIKASAAKDSVEALAAVAAQYEPATPKTDTASATPPLPAKATVHAQSPENSLAAPPADMAGVPAPSPEKSLAAPPADMAGVPAVPRAWLLPLPIWLASLLVP